MLKLQSLLCCHIVIIFYLSQTANGIEPGKSSCASPQVNYVRDYTNAWKNIKMCFRVGYSKAITDSDGRIYSSYRVELNEGEDPNELCRCIKKFNLQSEWWKGAMTLCYDECNTVTLLIIGVPDKKFINATPIYAGKSPIDIFIEVYSRYGNAEVWEDRCLAKTGVNEAGYKHVLWTCDYTGDNLPSKDKLCEYIYNYANGNDGGINIIGDTATHKCTIKGGKFYLDVVAKKKEIFCHQ